MAATRGSPAVRRASALLTEIAAHPEGRTVPELSRQLGMPISSTYDLVNDLVDLVALSRHPDGRVVLGDDFASLARGFVDGTVLIERFRAAAVTSWELSDVTLLLACERDGSALILATHRGEQNLPITMRAGMRWPMDATAAGIVLQVTEPAHRSERVSAARVAGIVLQVTEPAHRSERVSAARVAGYSIVERTSTLPLVSVAVPVSAASPVALCALLDADRRTAQELVEPLRRLAERIA